MTTKLTLALAGALAMSSLATAAWDRKADAATKSDQHTAAIAAMQIHQPDVGVATVFTATHNATAQMTAPLDNKPATASSYEHQKVIARSHASPVLCKSTTGSNHSVTMALTNTNSWISNDKGEKTLVSKVAGGTQLGAALDGRRSDFNVMAMAKESGSYMRSYLAGKSESNYRPRAIVTVASERRSRMHFASSSKLGAKYVILS